MSLKNNALKYILFLLQGLIKSAFNPVTIVSAFGAIIINIAFTTLKNNVDLLPIDNPLRQVVENNWSEALVDFSIQYIVLLIALILVVFDIMKIVFERVKKQKVEDFFTKSFNDHRTLLISLITLIIVIWLVIEFITGGYATPETIQLYYDNAQQHKVHDGGIHTPPWSSPITIWRIVIGLYGVVFTAWAHKVLGELFNDGEARQ